MPANITIDHAHEFITATVEGQLDFDKTKELLREIASALGPSVDYEVFLDVRKAKSKLTITDLWYVAAELSDLRKVFSRKTAVLCPLERFDYAGFLALCAQNRGFWVNTFTSFGAAMEWLIKKEPDTSRRVGADVLRAWHNPLPMTK